MHHIPIGDVWTCEEISKRKELIEAAEESGVLMAIHPDDPPWTLFGLPRIVGSQKAIEQILSAYDSTANGITLCTGSFGAS